MKAVDVRHPQGRRDDGTHRHAAVPLDWGMPRDPGPHHTPASMMLALQGRVGNRGVTALLEGRYRGRSVIQRHAATEDPELTAAADVAGVRIDTLGLAEEEESPAAHDVTPEEPAAVQREVGIAGKGTVKKYVNSTAKTLTGAETKPLDEFLKAQEAALNAALGKHKVPFVPLTAERMGPDGTRCHFVGAKWVIAVNLDMVGDPIGTAAGQDLAAVLYHEARHAEQWFAMTRHVIHTLRSRDDFQDDNPYTIKKAIQAPHDIIMAAIKVMNKSKKSTKPFNKKEKSAWAKNLYERSVRPGTSLSNAGLSDEVLTAEREPAARQAELEELLRQQQLLQNARSQSSFVGPPLGTKLWPANDAAIVNGLWASLLLDAEAELRRQKVVDARNPFTEDMLQIAVSYPQDGPLAQARDHYLDMCEKLLSGQLAAAQNAYDEAYKRYRALPIEADAFAVQDLVANGLRKPSKE